MNLISAAERLAAMDRSAVKQAVNRCLHTRDRFSTCSLCFDICPTGAINPGSPPAFDPGKCQSCLACLAICPVGAFQADDSVSALLTCITRAETKTIELVCGKNPDAETGNAESVAIRIKGCLAGLGSGTYLMLAALGVEKTIVRMDACPECEWAGLHKQVEMQVSQARQLLSMWGKAANVVCWSEIQMGVQRPEWEASNPPLTRRNLLRMAAQQGQISMARAMENKNPNQEKGVGINRRRLLSAVEHLAAPCVNNPMPLRDFGFTSLAVSDLCTACGVCANVCPTQALRLEKAEDDSSFKLTFIAKNCIGCEACVHVCAPAAVTLDHAPDFMQVFGSTEPLIVHSGTLVRCSRCRTLMAEHEGIDLCALCEYRKNHPFGSMLPPGVKIPRSFENKKSLS